MYMPVKQIYKYRNRETQLLADYWKQRDTYIGRLLETEGHIYQQILGNREIHILTDSWKHLYTYISRFLETEGHIY